MPTNSNLNKIFVYVPSEQVATFKTDAGKSAAYKGKIAFLAGTGEIMTNGEIFAVNKDADIKALQDLIGQFSNLGLGNDFSGETIVSAIKYVYDLANSQNDSLDARLDTLEGEGEGSVKKAVNDAVTALVDGAPEALNTLKEIADWIAKDTTGATNLITRMENAEAKITENEQNTTAALQGLQEQINSMTGGAGSIQTQITNNINTLDGTVTLAGTTAAQPSEIGIETSVDVLGSITVAEVDGILKQDESAKVVLQADAAGAAKKAYDTLYGNDGDTIDALTMKGVKARVDYKTRTGALSIGTSASNQTVNYDTSTGELATVKNVADTINAIEMWETYSAS